MVYNKLIEGQIDRITKWVLLCAQHFHKLRCPGTSHTLGLITHPGPSPYTHTHPNKSKDTINFTIFLITAGVAGYDMCTINMLIPVKLVRLNE